jgi:hypothetical protein
VCTDEARAAAQGAWPSNVFLHGHLWIGFWPADVAVIGAAIIYAGSYWVVTREQSARRLTADCLERKSYAIEGRPAP